MASPEPLSVAAHAMETSAACHCPSAVLHETSGGVVSVASAALAAGSAASSNVNPRMKMTLRIYLDSSLGALAPLNELSTFT